MKTSTETTKNLILFKSMFDNKIAFYYARYNEVALAKKLILNI